MRTKPLVTKEIPKIANGRLAQDFDLSVTELEALLELAGEVKQFPSQFSQKLAGKHLSLLFEKPSLRTRMTFELAIKQLGGDAVVSIGPVAEREPVKDVARNLDRWTNGIVARVFKQSTIEELDKHSQVPVINALSDLYHPCQALADVLTMKEHFGSLKGLRIAYVGDPNNVARSLSITALGLGANVCIAHPEGYEPSEEFLSDIRLKALQCPESDWSTSNNPQAALKEAQVVYTDVWTSMGRESEAAEREKIFAPYQVNEELFSHARPDAVFMHCLPAKRGLEVTDAVMEHRRSIVFDQAENRLHAQKALLLMLLG